MHLPLTLCYKCDIINIVGKIQNIERWLVDKKNRVTIEKRMQMLLKWCKMSDADVFAEAINRYPKNSKMNAGSGRYVYIDKGSDILAVAHVDTVASSPKLYYYGNKDVKTLPIVPEAEVKGHKVTTIKLDDRLGVHLIMDILPLMGINVDILLTDDEEYGSSTAFEFIPPEGKKYNWAFSFDRRGIGEVVMYQYGTDKDAIERVEDAGWYFGKGTYSDISDLYLGCSCFNFSAGYMNEHTDWCFCQYDAVMYNAQLFKNFYLKNKDRYFPYVQKPKDTKSWYKYDEKWYDAYNRDEWDDDYTWRNYTYKAKKQEDKKYRPPETCTYCGKANATTWDEMGNPLCDNCDEYYNREPPVEECTYCGNQMSSDGKAPEVADDQFVGVCISCANWLRENMTDADWHSMGIKLRF